MYMGTRVRKNVKIYNRNYFILAILVAFLIAWMIILLSVGPENIVKRLGITNSYMLIFLVAAFGGISSVTAFSFYTVLSTLAIGGLNPLLLGLIGGIGVTFGDSIFFYLGKKGNKVIKNSKAIIKIFNTFAKKVPSWLMPLVIFLYAAFVPLPNDIMMVSLGLARYPFKFTFLPILIGNMLSVMIIAYLIGYSSERFF